MFRPIRHLVCAAVLDIAPLSAAHACDTDAPCCEYVRARTYVTTYETSTRWVTVQDEYGCCHRVPQTCTVPVRVPVTRLVKVCH